MRGGQGLWIPRDQPRGEGRDPSQTATHQIVCVDRVDDATRIVGREVPSGMPTTTLNVGWIGSRIGMPSAGTRTSPP